MPVGRFFLPSFLPVGRSGGLSIGGGPARPDRREPAGPGRGPRGRGPGRRRRRRFPGCCLREGRALVAGSRAGPTAERRERAGRLTASGAGPAVAAGDQDSARARTKPAREPGPGAPGGARRTVLLHWAPGVTAPKLPGAPWACESLAGALARR